MIRTLLPILFLCSCGSSSIQNTFRQPTLVAVDSTNDRVFTLEKNGILLLNKASDLTVIGTQPVIDEDTEAALSEVLPKAPTHMAVVSIGTTSRLFITGALTSGDNRVLNRILVVDYNGSFSVPDIAIDVADLDATTTDTDDLIGGMVVDETNSRLYVTSVVGRLHVYNLTDGTEAGAFIAISGTPNRISLNGNLLYVANRTATEVDQVITIVNTGDFTVNVLDLDVPTDHIQVLSNSNGTVLIAKTASSQQLLVRTLDTTTFVATPIPAGDSSVTNGEVNSSFGLTSSIGSLILTSDSSGTLYGYVGQSDGNLLKLTISANLSEFSAETVSSLTTALNSMAVYRSNGVGAKIFITANASGELLSTDVASSSITVTF